MKKSKQLKDLIQSTETLVMPDAYDPVSARIIEYMGFKAVQCSGYSFSIAACKPHEMDISLDENLRITAQIVQSVSIPVMADGEDGFGGVEQTCKTIESFIEAGVAGINLEDQVPDRMPTIKVIEMSLMQEKIKAARETAAKSGNHYFIINGRTDVLGTYESRKKGLIESVKRANAYLEAGADLVFVTRVRTLEEAEILVKEINGPLSIAAGLSYNIKNFSVKDLTDIGVARVSLPTIAVSSAINAMMKSTGYLRSFRFNNILDEGLLCSDDEIEQLING